MLEVIVPCSASYGKVVDGHCDVTFSQDIRHAARRLLSARGFTLTTILLLGLGIGASTAIFSVVEAVLLRPLVPDQDRIVVMYPHDPTGDSSFTPISLPDFFDWQDRSAAFVELAAFGMEAGTVSLGSHATSVEARASLVTPAFFSVLGQTPCLGRGFLPGEERPDAERVVVLSEGLWQQAFGGDEEILGTRIKLDARGEPYTIVGVMPPGFDFPNRSRIWMVARNEPPIDNRGWSFLLTVGRLAPGVTPEQARSEMEIVDSRMLEETRSVLVPRRIATVPFTNFLLGENTRSSLRILGAAVGILFVIACVNVTALFLTRTASRHREIAIRTALGASRGRIARLLLAETAIVSLAGGVLGVVLARAAVTTILAIAPSATPRLSDVEVELSTVAFAVLLAGVAALLVGLTPGLARIRGSPDARWLADCKRGLHHARSAYARASFSSRSQSPLFLSSALAFL